MYYVFMYEETFGHRPEPFMLCEECSNILSLVLKIVG